MHCTHSQGILIQTSHFSWVLQPQEVGAFLLDSAGLEHARRELIRHIHLGTDSGST